MDFVQAIFWILFTNTVQPFFLDKVILDNTFVFAGDNHGFREKSHGKKNSNDYLICLSSMLCYFFKTLKCNLFPEKKWMI